MKKYIWKLIKHIPIISWFIDKLQKQFDIFENEIALLKKENTMLAFSNVHNRIRIKALTGEKINIVFVCFRPAIWTSLATVYTALKNDDMFDVKIIAIPNKKELPDRNLSHDEYISEGAEVFWKDFGCVNGYNYETQEWLDIRLLNPDYVFFQQPYNICYNTKYKTSSVSRYAKICYVPYAHTIIASGVFESCNPPDFLENLSFYFTMNEDADELTRTHLKRISNDFTKVIITGFPRYDNIKRFVSCESSLWSYPRSSNKFRIIWTPRWTTIEGNSSFFDYKDKLLEYCDTHSDIDFIFRPHPQAFAELHSTGELTEKEAEIYKAEYQKRPNAVIDNTKEYFETFFSSDCLVTDASSIMADYFITGKPIIYCHKISCFTDFAEKLSEGFYWVNNWQELQQTFDMLKKGNDPLKQKRLEIIKSQFDVSKEGAGHAIAAIIKKDVKGQLE